MVGAEHAKSPMTPVEGPKKNFNSAASLPKVGSLAAEPEENSGSHATEGEKMRSHATKLFSLYLKNHDRFKLIQFLRN